MAVGLLTASGSAVFAWSVNQNPFLPPSRKSAILHPGPGSGRILYEPDANDDYDQEDPDDDLDV